MRQGSQIFVLHKGLNPFYEVGTVENIPTLQTMSYYQNMPMLPIDLTVRIGEKVTPYQHIPPTAESAKVSSQLTGEEVCIACSKEAVSAEVEMLIHQSVDTINSVEAQMASKERQVSKLKEIIEQLNKE